MSILFINACVREEESRTLTLATHIMTKTNEDIVEVNLQHENLMPLNHNTLLKRDILIINKNFNDEMFRFANQFASADKIIIATPYWDLGFPAILKIYLEHITVSGITFKYDNCKPFGLCKAKKLIYVTTSGGPIIEDFGYPYIKSLCQNLFGIKETYCYKSENLDIELIKKEELLEKAPPTLIK